jgi:hypothetical protein
MQILVQEYYQMAGQIPLLKVIIGDLLDRLVMNTIFLMVIRGGQISLEELMEHTLG